MNRLLFLFLLLPVKSLYAQTDASKDSLLKVLSLAKEDTNKVLALITTGQYVEYNNLEEAKNYYLQARRLSEKMNYTLGILKYYSNYTAVLNIQAKFDSALVLTKDALQLANRFGNEERIIIAQQNLSATYSYLQDYESALQYLLPSVAYFEKTKNDARLSLIYDNLGVIYRETKQYDKALEFHQKALAIARKSGNSYDIANVLSNLGNAYSSSKRYDSALVIMQDGLGIARKENYDNIESNIISNIGAVLIKQGRYDSLTYYCTLGLRLAEKLGDSLAMVNNIYGLALYSFFTSDFTKSGELAKTGFRMAQQRNYVEPSQLFADILSELSLVKGDLRNYDYYNRLSIELSEQFFNDRMQRNVQLLDKKYDTEKKEKLLVIQQATILRKNTLNYILIGSAVTLLIVSILSYRNYKQKQKLQEQKIIQLGKEKLLLATQSIVKGQEEERNRLAQDLHDGLGGLLSGVKLQLGAMKGNLILSEEHGLIFNNALSKLDESISEMRRVAHNMMPEALMKLGLQQALQDYCDSLSAGQAYKINCEFHGLENRMEPTIEIVVYRVVQELLNNAIKHSDASIILAQVMRNDNNLTITIEDNGKGFTMDEISILRGSGLKNIKSRVDYLKGQIDIQSAPGKGTSIHIDCII
ncbi:MAG: sensor histidine kinase [Chitinophagaceae bacterium]|nr:sensor histidine kinase [Chitinophagaceae bacterium]MBK7679221.1 sensor histidine kinase [Chitinophagaceae bacterium]MBK8299438.1 sensor histidine kinase [Chitinophagaceae bacterium]MBK9659393.1 sensor histidine kinase [Chitinophagaceae bacterium]MBK9937082.1 sensor histidine kinase [Chitinophagaceae bacterium]